MKKEFLILLSILLLLLGCSKDDDSIVTPNSTSSPIENPLLAFNTDTTFSDLNIAPQSKVLLMQEFTGVYCYTCPLAHTITANLIQMYPNRIAAMNVHSHFYGLYDDPAVMGNLYDFRTFDGDTIVSMIGGVFSVPSAAFNMTIQPGESKITSYLRDNWIGYATNELNGIPRANVEIATTFNASNRNLKIVIKYHIQENISENLYYNVALVENKIIDKQFVDTVVVDNYSHEHIFRDALTDPKANFLASSPSQGEVFIKVINYTVSSNWNENNIEIISYIHEKDIKWNVLQTAILKIN